MCICNSIRSSPQQGAPSNNASWHPLSPNQCTKQCRAAHGSVLPACLPSPSSHFGAHTVALPSPPPRPSHTHSQPQGVAGRQRGGHNRCPDSVPLPSPPPTQVPPMELRCLGQAPHAPCLLLSLGALTVLLDCALDLPSLAHPGQAGPCPDLPPGNPKN